MLQLPSIYITEKGVRHAKTGHPWVFEGEVVRTENDPVNGELANVFSDPLPIDALLLRVPFFASAVLILPFAV